ncbi:hypothetical protein GGI35DRAFT_162903 [Trichoderma velutinum]
MQYSMACRYPSCLLCFPLLVRVNAWSMMHVNPCVQVLVMSGAISALKTAPWKPPAQLCKDTDLTRPNSASAQFQQRFNHVRTRTTHPGLFGRTSIFPSCLSANASVLQCFSAPVLAFATEPEGLDPMKLPHQLSAPTSCQDVESANTSLFTLDCIDDQTNATSRGAMPRYFACCRSARSSSRPCLDGTRSLRAD